MVYTVSVIAYTCQYHENCQQRRAFAIVAAVVAIVDPPTGNKDLVFLFVLLVWISFLVIVFSIHVYFFVLVYFFVGIFPPTPPTYTAVEAYWQIPISTPSISLLDNNVWIFPSHIIRNHIHLLREQKIPPHELITTFIPAYPVWHHRLQPQLRWGHQWFPKVRSCPILYLLTPPGASLCTKSWDSWVIGLPPLPTPLPTKTRILTMKTTKAMGVRTGVLV